ncbi:hypothetical protein JB92DRAFT_3145924 [Gautieria morchelliformis]|nr:hypothetical protein JB92DRAFT_3145924 [Gautieria morchelliformis]
MSVSPAYAPQEPPALIRIERAFFVEMSFEAVLYGFTLCLYIMTVNNLVKKENLRSSWKLVTFLSVQQIAVLLGVAGNINLAMLAFIDNRNIPGGPAVYQQEFSNRPFAFAALAGYTISTWMQDVLLLYRFLVIWHGYYLLFVFPFMIFLTSIAFSLLLLIQTGQRAGLISNLNKIPVPIIFFSLSVGLNVVLTTLIVGRLLAYRRRLDRSLGYQHTRPYVTIMAIVIESAALYTCVGIAQVVSLRLDPAIATGIQGMYGMMTALAPHLIAFRVSQGRAWTRNMSDKTSVDFGFAKPSANSRNTETTAFGSQNDIVLSSRGGGSTTKLGQTPSSHKESIGEFA